MTTTRLSDAMAKVDNGKPVDFSGGKKLVDTSHQPHTVSLKERLESDRNRLRDVVLDVRQALTMLDAALSALAGDDD